MGGVEGNGGSQLSGNKLAVGGGRGGTLEGGHLGRGKWAFEGAEKGWAWEGLAFTQLLPDRQVVGHW